MNWNYQKDWFLNSLQVDAKKVFRFLKLKGDPIFIVGCGRSGTSLLLSIISAHPKIFGFPVETEIMMIEKRHSSFINRINNKRKLIPFLKGVPLKKTATRWCEKTPRNIHFIDAILNSYKNPKIIHIIRDGRDVVTSKHPTSDKYWVSPERWVSEVKLGLKYQRNANVLTIKYEELLMEFEDSLNRIFQFLNEMVTNEVLNYEQNTDVKEMISFHNGKVKSIYKTALNKWERPEFEKRIEEAYNYNGFSELLTELNYV